MKKIVLASLVASLVIGSVATYAAAKVETKDIKAAPVAAVESAPSELEICLQKAADSEARLDCVFKQQEDLHDQAESIYKKTLEVCDNTADAKDCKAAVEKANNSFVQYFDTMNTAMTHFAQADNDGMVMVNAKLNEIIKLHTNLLTETVASYPALATGAAPEADKAAK